MKTFPMDAVRKELGAAVLEFLGSTSNVKTTFHSETLKIETDEEKPWDRTKVEIHLNTNIEGDEVLSYYVNYWSGWSSSKQASSMSFLLGAASQIAARLEEMGVPFKG